MHKNKKLLLLQEAQASNEVAASEAYKTKAEEVKAKEAAMADLKRQFGEREKKLLADLVSSEKSRNTEVDKVKAEVKEVQAKLTKKEEKESKLEKDKRDALIAKDKANKLVDTARAERDQVSQNRCISNTKPLFLVRSFFKCLMVV